MCVICMALQGFRGLGFGVTPSRVGPCWSLNAGRGM